MKRITKFGLIFVLIFAWTVSPVIAQQRSIDNIVSTQLQRNAQVKSPQKENPPPIKVSVCNLKSIGLSEVSVLLNCTQKNADGIMSFYIPVGREANKLSANLAIKLAKTELTEPGWILKIRYRTATIPAGKFCMSRAFSDTKCREALSMVLARGT